MLVYRAAGEPSMRLRRVLAGVGIAVLGAYLLLVPIVSTTVASRTVPPGFGADAVVSLSVSLFGQSVQVDVRWGTTVSPCYGLSCPGLAFPAYLSI